MSINKPLRALLFLFFFILAIKLSLNPLAAYIAQRKLKNIFVDSRVSIGSCQVRPLSSIKFLNVELVREPLYDLKLKEIDIRYSPVSIMKGGIPRVSLRDASAVINTKQEGILIENVSLDTGGRGAADRLSIERIKYNEIKAEDIQSRIALTQGSLSFGAIAGRIMDGKFTGDVSISLTPGFAYTVNLALDGLDIASFIRDAGLKEKFVMTGKFGGSILLKGNGPRISILGGDLLAAQPGGTLTIKDNEYLKSIAEAQKVPVELLVESFNEYQYNIGKLSLKKQGESLILEIALEGTTGKRNLTVVVHDFSWLKPA
ncbi:MAG: YdbH domain-containing protein [Candidatus Omnitrophica bacterium]|nr:YdbH domain-containing protein [Candidatus Omnitrophota bacterium]